MSYARTRNVLHSTTNFEFVKHKIGRSFAFSIKSNIILPSVEISDISKALAKYVFRVADNEKRVLIYILYDLSYIGDLRALYDAQQHLLFVVGICALALYNGDAAVQLIGYVLRYLLLILAYDIANARIVDTVKHQIDDLRDNKHRYNRVHRSLYPVKDRGKSNYYHRVRDKHYGAKIYIRESQADKFRYYIRAAGRCTGIVDHAETETLDRAADDTGKQHIVGGRIVYQRQNIDQHRGQQHSHKGADDEFTPEMLPRDDKQRYVQHYRHNTDGKLCKVINYHRDTADTADDDGVRVQEELEARRKEH